ALEAGHRPRPRRDPRRGERAHPARGGRRARRERPAARERERSARAARGRGGRTMRTLAVVVALALAGCGGQAFAASFRERAEPEMSRVLEAIAAAPAREETPVIVAVAPDGAIAAWDLREGRRIWSVSAEPTATPVIAGRYVVATEREGLSV